MINLLVEKSLDKIAENTGTCLWKGFVSFRSASAGILAIFIIIRLIKLIIDTIIHGYALPHLQIRHSSSVAVWSSIIQFFLHLGKPIKAEQGDENEEE